MENTGNPLKFFLLCCVESESLAGRCTEKLPVRQQAESTLCGQVRRREVRGLVSAQREAIVQSSRDSIQVDQRPGRKDRGSTAHWLRQRPASSWIQ